MVDIFNRIFSKPQADDEKYLALAITLAEQSVNLDGGPFGALILGPKKEVFGAANMVTSRMDPTAHAEIQAIRLAAERLNTHDLSGTILYSSCEPCPMCLGAALWARVDRIVFAADRFDAARAGFDDAAFYKLLEKGGVAKQVEMENRRAPFEAWEKLSTKVKY
jgi:guanine deaminase